MSFDQEACLVKTGQTGGLDLFFGNGYNGKVPELGSTILIEYLVTDGDAGNIDNLDANASNQWKFNTSGYSLNNEEIDLNKFLNVKVKNSILFGTLEEPLYLTRLLAPHMSRSFVLANSDNYVYFLRKLNQFSIIDAIPGFATFDDQYALDKYNQARTNYEEADKQYREALRTFGADSPDTLTKKGQLDAADQVLKSSQRKLQDQKLDDNTVYLFLIPDVTKRIAPGVDYFDAPIEAFKMTSDEKQAILDLIEESGQRVLTVDNAILDIQYVNFVVNLSLILWEGYEYDTVREAIISALSDYLLKFTRRDRLPVSDIIRVVENVEGVDSVNAWFDADKSNYDIYGSHYGIDDYGDIILERYVNDAWNNKVPVKDVYPLFRGGWESYNGVEYNEGTVKNQLSTVNIQVRGYTRKTANDENNQAILKNVGSNR